MSNSFNVVEIVTSNNTSEIASFVATPDLNDSGTIAFFGTDNSSESGIYTVSGNATSETVITNSQLEEGSLGSKISFNNNEAFLYTVSILPPPFGVGDINLVLNENGTTTTIDSVFQDRNRSAGYQDLYLNENNFAVAKTGLLGPSLSVETIILISPDGTQENVAQSVGVGNNSPRLTDLGDIAFNNQNLVAYGATKTTFDEFGRPIDTENSIFVTDGTQITLEDGVTAGDLALNDSGLLVYSTDTATATGARGEILQRQGNNTTSLANTDGLFADFGEISLNNSGEIVFSGVLDDGEEAIFAGFNATSDLIIATGDALSGSTVSDLEFSQEGLNNSGLITFKAELANGTQGIYRVDIRDRSMANIINGTTRADNLVGTVGIDIINGRSGKDTIQGLAGNDTISGGIGNDTLKGGDGNDQIKGDSGRDILDGGSGNDILTGGIGNDSFVLKVEAGTDLVNDYQDRQDKFILSGGLEFNNLTLVQNGNNTEIQLTATDEVLATVNSVMANALNFEDFIVSGI